MGITNQNGALYFATGIDNSGLKADAEEAKKIIGGMSSEVNKISQAAIDTVKNQVDKAKETVKNLESMVAGLKKRMEDAAPGNSKQSAILNFNEANRSLNNQKTLLAGLEKQQRSLIGKQREQMEVDKASMSSKGGVIASLSKWAVGVFSVSAALELGKRIMNSTEAATQSLEIVTEQATTGVSFFFKTIASGDWSNFTEGMARAIQGAKDYVIELENIKNLTNEQKIKSSSLDIKIGEARADSYSTDPKVVKKALQTLVALQTEKLTGEADIAKKTMNSDVRKLQMTITGMRNRSKIALNFTVKIKKQSRMVKNTIN